VPDQIAEFRTDTSASGVGVESYRGIAMALAPAGDLGAHTVQLYEDDAYLARVVADYVADGLAAGCACIVIATGGHADAVEASVRAAGHDLSGAAANGTYFRLDAARMLARFMVGGMPDPSRFAEVVGGVVGRAARGGRPVRAFGEMVALLWQAGNAPAAIRLEELWNDLNGRPHHFELLCGYPTGGFASEGEAAGFAAVCRQHRSVVPDERYGGDDTEDGRLRVIAELQRRASQLRAEVVARKDAEDRARRSESRAREALNAVLAMAEALVADATSYRDGADEAGGSPEEIGSLAAADASAESRHFATEPAGGAWTDEGERAFAAARGPVRALVALARSMIGGRFVGAAVADTATRQVFPLAVVGQSEEDERRWWADLAPPDLVARLADGEVVTLDLADGPPPRGQNSSGPSGVLVAPARLGADRLLLVVAGAPDGPGFGEYERGAILAAARLAVQATERERLLDERANATAEALALRAANERMDEFLGVVSHELRTPLTSSYASAQVALRRLHRLGADLADTEQAADDRDADRRLRTALASIELLTGRVLDAHRRQMRLVDDLLDLSRIRAGKLELRAEEADLVAIVRDRVEDQRLQRPDREVRLDLPDGPVLVVVDADRIGQVVSNFLGNALKYSPEATAVDVRLDLDGVKGEARLTVRDEGPGLDPHEQRRIWERFYRAKGVEVQSGSGVGLGLGLFICRSIVEQHGGQAGVASAPGEGSAFWFAVPLAAGARATADGRTGGRRSSRGASAIGRADGRQGPPG
jgi:signal transduction histidine kinase